MTIYVDNMQRRARVGRLTATWSHLMSDAAGDEGTVELLAFARRLGLRAEWLQHPGKPMEHFDVTETKRQLALELGAEPIEYGPSGGGQITLAKARAMKRRKQTQAMRYRKRSVEPTEAVQDAEVETVQYRGSTTQQIAIRRWLRGGEYVNPTVRTRDIMPMRIHHHGELTVQPFDWIVKDSSGELSIHTTEELVRLYVPITRDQRDA